MKEKEILGFEANRKEIQEWRSKYEFLSAESEDWKAKYIALENKTALMAGEMDRLRKMGGDQQKYEFVINEWRTKYGDVEQKINSFLSEIERLKSTIITITSEKEAWKMRFEGQEAEFRERLIVYENKMTLLVSEIERMRKMGSRKDEEIGNQMRMSGEWNLKVKRAEESTEMMKRKVEEMMNEMGRFNGRNQHNLMIIVILYAEIERLRGLAGL